MNEFKRVEMVTTQVVDGATYEAGRFYLVPAAVADAWAVEDPPACVIDEEWSAD